jgi:hypothetical protein
MALVKSFNRRGQILKEAWIGDAVLCLYADQNRSERRTGGWRETGTDSEVEAEIGRLYQPDGLDAVFLWIEQRLMPLFDLQEKKLDLQEKKLDLKGKKLSARKKRNGGVSV